MKTPEEIENHIQSFVAYEFAFAHQLERFAVQLGCSPAEAVRMTERVFRHLRDQWETIKVDESHPKIAFRWMIRDMQRSTIIFEPSDWLQFEEDQNLFYQLQQLPFEERIVIVLHELQNQSFEAISEIIDKPVSEIKALFKQAKQRIQLDQLEKRISFLRVSFSRYPNAYEPLEEQESNRRSPMNEEVAIATESKKSPAVTIKTVLSWSIALVVLIGLAFYTYFTSDEYRQAAAESYVNSLHEQFEKEFEEKMARLGITSSLEDLHTFFESDMTENAREEFNLLVRDIEQQQRNGERLHKNTIEERYDEIRKRLRLPSELVAALERHPMHQDYEGSLQFLELYVQKQNALSYLYHVEVNQYESVLYPLLRNVKEPILTQETIATFPEELQQFIQAMDEQFVTLVPFPGSWSWYPQFDFDLARKKLQPLLHEDTHVYLLLLDSPQYLFEDPTISSGDYVAELDRLFLMEKELRKQNRDTMLAQNLHSHYMMLVNIILGRPYGIDIYTDERTVKEGVKRTWLTIMEGDPTSPVVQILQPIVDEMESSNWQWSETYQLMDESYIYQVLMDALEGRPIRSATEIVHYEEEQAQVISLNDPHYWDNVKTIYQDFQQQYDTTPLQEVSPLYIFGMVILAERQNDLLTIWQLLNPDQRPADFSTFQLEWKLSEHRYSGNEMISVGNQNMLNGQPLVPILIAEGGTETYGAWLILDEKTNVWMFDSYVN